MKKFLEKIEKGMAFVNKHPLFMFAIMVVCSIFGAFVCDGVMCADPANPGTGDGSTDGPASVASAQVISPDLDMSDVEKFVTELLPSRHPVFSILQDGRRSQAQSWKHDWYVSDYMPVLDETTASAAIALTPLTATALPVAHKNYFELHQTIFVKDPTIVGKYGDGFALLVVDIPSSGSSVSVVPINPDATTGTKTIPANTPLILGGTAKGEDEWTADSKVIFPLKEYNYLQKFMVKISETEYQKLNKKEINWGMSDYLRNRLFDMKTKIEMNFLFGSLAEVNDPVKGNMKLTTKGFKNFGVKNIPSPTTWNDGTFIDMYNDLFEDNNGSDKRYALCDKTFLANVLKTPFVTRIKEAASTSEELNINWGRISIGGNTLLYKKYNILDRIGTSNCAIIIDPANIGKAVQIPMEEHFEGLDVGRTKGENSSAVVIRETSCPVVYNPLAHAIIGNVFA
ncbi:hypothetical protein AGMMS49965_13230 [Bacteroidia bacterium]|nr:hypothetical protein AGMMS49965_13230 [Bacteroidia bacterium]